MLPSSPVEVVQRANVSELGANPVKRCMAGPFVFPAVSERAWTGVIDPIPGCILRAFGYESYGITSDHQQVTVELCLLPSMQLERTQ